MFKDNATAAVVIVLLLAILGLQIYKTFWHKPAPQPMKVVMVPREGYAAPRPINRGGSSSMHSDSAWDDFEKYLDYIAEAS